MGGQKKMASFKFKKTNLNIPNFLTLLRIVLLVPFVIFVTKDQYGKAGVILILSGLTDLMDGYIARKLNQITNLGKMLDPTADKLTLMTIMVCISLKFPRMVPFMVILIIKEILMLGAGGILLKLKKSPPSSQWYGKVSTVVFYVSVITIISVKAVMGKDIEILNNLLMIFTSICMLYSLWKYFEIFKTLIKSDKVNL